MQLNIMYYDLHVDSYTFYFTYEYKNGLFVTLSMHL